MKQKNISCLSCGSENMSCLGSNNDGTSEDWECLCCGADLTCNITIKRTNWKLLDLVGV